MNLGSSQELLILCFFILGACLGSFISTTALRLSVKRSLLTPSCCDSCSEKVGMVGLIPLLGYAFKKGKCTYCRAKISPLYPAFELFNGLVFVWLFLHLGLSPELIQKGILFELLMVFVLTDLIAMEVYIGPMILVLLVQSLWLWYFQPYLIQDALIGLLAGAGVLHWVSTLFFYFRGREGLGLGDASLFGIMGFIFGWQKLLPILLIASLFGVLGGAFVLQFQKKSLQKEIAFGPWLIGAAILVWISPNWLTNLIP
ncbi:MAG: prepilin peptidase [SAR324 cluster bacterium]|nr:prepilin peptidase [SAR324 cluster bacterium]